MITTLPYDERVKAIYADAEALTGVVVDPEVTIRPAVEAGNVLFYLRRQTPVAFLHFVDVVMPDTSEHVLVERMLYSPRSGFAARALLGAFELTALERECAAVLAGSSLGNNAAARRLYEATGYTTNYTFRKDLLCATQ
jgi:hypothetical protein